MTAPPQPLEAAGTITLKAAANLPARLFGGNAQTVTVTGLDYTLHLDIEKLPADETPAGPDYWAPVWDKNTDTYKRIDISSLTGGLFGATPPPVRPTVTGSRGGNAALASLLTALAATGILVDGTTV